MTTNSKPRVRVRAATSTIETTIQQIMGKAASEIADSVDVVPLYDPDFQGQLARVPTEHGVTLPMSGDGPQTAVEAYSQLANQTQTLTQAYSAMAGMLMQHEKSMKSMHKAIAILLAKATGTKVAKTDWESSEAKEDADKNEDEPEESDVEKARAAVKSGTASVPQLMMYLEHGPAERVRPAPDFSQKALAKSALVDSELFAMRTADMDAGGHAEAMAIRAGIHACIATGTPIESMLRTHDRTIAATVFPEMCGG